MYKRFGEKGIALMLVLTAITVITTAVTEFAYNTNINYHLALNERDRAMAYNLADSAYKFMLLDLKFDRMYRSMVQRYNLGEYLGAAVQQPLCQQFPMSTELIRNVFLGGGLSAMIPGSEGENTEEAPPPEALSEGLNEEENNPLGVSMSQKEGASDFLDFTGDFEAACVDEGTKFSLNGFAGLSATSEDGKISPLDSYKILLTELLQRPEYKVFFEEGKTKPEDIVDNIADWVDDDELANKKGGRTQGVESAQYSRADIKYPIRDGKLITLNEAYLIDGITHDWFESLSDRLTVYGDGKINPCTADTSLIETIVRNYVTGTPGLPPTKIEDPEVMGPIVTKMLESCDTGATGDALVEQVANGFAEAIGANTSGEVSPKTIIEDFKKIFMSEARFFRLNLTGKVDPISINIEAVVDIKETEPKKWSLLYWRVY